MTANVFGSYTVSWFRDNVFTLSEATTPGSPALINSNSLFALFFVENPADKFLPTSSANNTTESWSTLLTNTGSSRLVATAISSGNFATRSLNLTEDAMGNNLPTSGQFFTVAFNFDASSLGINESDSSTWNVTIPANTFAFISDLTTVPWTTDPLAPSTPLSVNSGGQYLGGGGAGAGSAITTTMLIPEPGTVALFLMGGVMMMIRHRRKRFLGR